jgi:hypothetical protein
VARGFSWRQSALTTPGAQRFSSYTALRFLPMRGSAPAPQTALILSRQIKMMNNVGHARPVFAEASTFAESVAIKASAVGIKIVDRLDKYLGRVEDIVIANRIAYVVFSVGGIFGFGKTQCMAPWKSLHRDRARKVYVLHQTPTQMVRAPHMRPANVFRHSRNQWSRNLWVLPTRLDAALYALLLRDISAIPVSRTNKDGQTAFPYHPTPDGLNAFRSR